jgi:hypothetical protein
MQSHITTLSECPPICMNSAGSLDTIQGDGLGEKEARSGLQCDEAVQRVLLPSLS